MSALARIKKTAAQHEQERQYDKALALYARLLDGAEAGEEEVDVALFNRAGDLALRTGDAARAVGYFERALDLYAAAGLLNNAVALGVKILRHAPHHLSAHYTLGVLYGRKGFAGDARHHLLTYAVQMQRAGRTDEAGRVLAEVAAACADGADLRAAYDAYGSLGGDPAHAAPLVTSAAAPVVAPAPAAPIPVAAVAPAEPPIGAPAVEPFDSWSPGLALGDDHLGAAAASPAASAATFDFLDVSPFDLEGTAAPSPAAVPVHVDDPAASAPLDLDLLLPTDPGATAERGADERPGADAFSFLDLAPATDAVAAPDRAADELVFLDVAPDAPAHDAPAHDALVFPTLEFDTPAHVAPLYLATDGAEFGDLIDAVAPSVAIEHPAADPVAHADEYAQAHAQAHDDLYAFDAGHVGGDAYAFAFTPPAPADPRPRPIALANEPPPLRLADLADVSRPRPASPEWGAPEAPAAAAAPDRPAHDRPTPTSQLPGVDAVDDVVDDGPAPVAAPVAVDGGLDLGAWLRETTPEESTRMTTAAVPQSGDEQADFDATLRAFTAGVSRAVGHEDFDSHYDLGVAFREMGLLDEAIVQFQRAAQAPGRPLRALEALAQCFLDAGQPELALSTLAGPVTAATAGGAGDAALIAVHYLMGAAAQALGRPEDARRWLVRVVATDVRFRDASSRLAALPPPTSTR